MTHSLRFNGIRVAVALLLGLCFVLGAHARTPAMAHEAGASIQFFTDHEAWPVRYTPKPAS